MSHLKFIDLDKYLLNQNGKIIHQIWFGTIPTKKEAKKTFESLRKYRDSWLIKNPSWKYICWDLSNCYEFMATHYPEHLDMYNSYPYQIQRCDIVRYFLLYHYGGLYADMDYYCNKSWDIVLEEYKKDIYLVETPNKISVNTHISNSLMYSKPRHIYWKYVFIELQKNRTMPIYYSRHMVIMFTTGPAILNKVYNMYKIKHKIGFYPYKYFHPYGLYDDILSLTNNAEIYAIHLGKGTWEKKDSKILIFFYTEYKLVLFIIFFLCIPIIFSAINSKPNLPQIQDSKSITNESESTINI